MYFQRDFIKKDIIYKEFTSLNNNYFTKFAVMKADVKLLQ
jgi:hypothetical protein